MGTSAKKKVKNHIGVSHCPVCKSRAIGFLSRNRCFCADCCVEFSIKQESINIFHLSIEGTPLRIEF